MLTISCQPIKNLRLALASIFAGYWSLILAHTDVAHARTRSTIALCGFHGICQDLNLGLCPICFLFTSHDCSILKSVSLPRLMPGIKELPKYSWEGNSSGAMKHLGFVMDSLTFEHCLNLSHHWLHTCLSIRWMITVSAIFFLHSPLLGSTETFF